MESEGFFFANNIFLFDFVVPYKGEQFLYTHGVILLHTLLVKYNNDLLGRQNSEQGMDEVTFFYVGDLFCIHLDTKYTNF